MIKFTIGKICNALIILLALFMICGACVMAWNAPPPPAWKQISESVYEVRGPIALARFNKQCKIISVSRNNASYRYLVVIESVYPLEDYEYAR
jgi:hypothetical protein